MTSIMAWLQFITEFKSGKFQPNLNQLEYRGYEKV